MEKAKERAEILLEALPYIKKFSGETMVVKFGGNAMVDEVLKNDFARDIILMKYVGINPIVVHGGGPQIGEFLKKLGIETRFVGGMRVTDDATMDVVQMVLVGKVNREIVGLINSNGGSAVGLSGMDGGLIRGKKLVMKDGAEGIDDTPPEIIDLGRVGEVIDVKVDVLNALDREMFIPVIAPVGVDELGETLNINADLVAGSIAGAIEARKLILLTDVPGVESDGSLVSSLTIEEAKGMIDKGEITGGMLPKMNCCIDAITNGIKKAHIIDGRVSHSVLLELFTDGGIGTQVVA